MAKVGLKKQNQVFCSDECSCLDSAVNAWSSHVDVVVVDKHNPCYEA